MIPRGKRRAATYLGSCKERTMVTIRRWGFSGLVGLLLLSGGAVRPAQDKAVSDKVTFEVARYERLGEVVRQQKGKVVVVSFWSTT
jgi:hypothetical protein